MPDETFGIADTADSTLENFFSRPIKIASYNWDVGTTLFEDFDPWTLYFQNLRVINRVCNFNLLRCKLKVKVLINGNGFYYGRAIVSYIPLHIEDKFTRNRSLIHHDLIAASQRPHIYVDPTTSQGGTLTLPFCWYSNALSIPAREWNRMGLMNLRTFGNLAHANGGTEGITISVFAWAEEVNLSIPTANVPGGISPQMGEQDEYGTGPISRPASAVARASGALTRVPVIAPYARATELAASTVSTVAQMFGLSRPAILEDINPVRPTFVGNMANTNMPDSTTKLTVDAKQELTIDPRTVGLGDADEMTIQSIACRESYLTSFEWKVPDPAETLLFNSDVTPSIWAEESGAFPEYHLPACAFASLPFKYWRGSMKFRFQIIASAYHKGRCKVTYDPSYPLTNEYNTNYTHVVDISQEKDFTITVGWGATNSMLEVLNPLVSAVPYKYGAPMGAPPWPYGNGILSFYVVNELSTPSTDASPIFVNVFVSMCDDFEVFEPTSSVIRDLTVFKPYEPQMGEIVEANEPIDLSLGMVKAPMLTTSDNTSKVFFGDPIASFRTCLKRYNYHGVLFLQDPGTVFFRFDPTDFPLYRGRDPAGFWQDENFSNYNYVQNTLMNYVTPAFVTRRGGIRWKHVRVGGQCCANDIMYVLRECVNCSQWLAQTNRSPMPASNSARTREANTSLSHTWAGAHATAVRNNPVLEFELPFYSNDRFTHAKTHVLTEDRHRIEGTWTAETFDSPFIQTFVASAEDFSLSFFCGAPIFYNMSVEYDVMPG